MTRQEIKATAKTNLSANLGSGILILLLLGVLLGAATCTFLGPIIITGPLMFGCAVYFLKVQRKEKSDVAQIFDGFQTFGESFLAFIIQSVFTFLWSLLLIVPGIIASIRYSQTWYIMVDTPGIPGNFAVNRSKVMMEGHKMEYFVFHMSFILWHLLSWVTLGLGYLYVGPYIQSAMATWYENLKTETIDNAQWMLEHGTEIAWQPQVRT